MLKKKLSIIFVIAIFILFALFAAPHNKTYKVTDIVSPVSFIIENDAFKIDGFSCFDTYFSENNKILAKELNMSEEEAFVAGNLGKYWAENILNGRKVYIKGNDLVYYRHSYLTKFMYSGFCLKDGKPFNREIFERRLNQIRKGNYVVLNPDDGSIYKPDDKRVRTLKNYLVVRKRHLPKNNKETKLTADKPETVFGKGNIKIFFADFTKKLKPDRNCSSSICKEILNRINSSKSTIDIAVYGYSRIPDIENALKSALKRGVKIRLVYDLNSKGENIYPDTSVLTTLLTNNKSDINSQMANNIMHNKFYIFDNKTVITGSANLSHTDMSGYNTNSIIVINSEDAAKIYTAEFEQMYGGKFHSDKSKTERKSINMNNTILDIYFSPQDKSLKNGVIPLINGAKEYIYMPTFLVTDKNITEALINAKNRGIDIKIIADALNASAVHSKHKELRNSGILVKTENYAGKMHSKSMVIDDMYTIIGSMNFSNSGENKNDENLVIIKDSEIAKFYKNFFIYQWSKIDNKWLKLNARAEGKDSLGSCSDGIDNNYDGLTDSEDSACR